MQADTAPVGDAAAEPGPRPEPHTAVVLALLLAATLLPRALVFPLNENLHGDAVARTELAERWLRDPHWISSFHDGAYQFGPLHLYTVGAALWAWPDREDAGRAVSLLFGVLSVIPLYLLSRRLLGWKAGLVAGLAFAAWGLHIQLSTTAASEALALFLVVCVLHFYARGRETGKVGPLFLSAVFLNLACATRYDAWLLVPLLAALLFFGDRDKVAATTRAVLFGLFCLPFPMLWMQGNEMETGSALYPVTYIQQFHDAWAASTYGGWAGAGYRVLNVFFWPGTALVTLSPLVGAFGIVGMVAAWRRFPEHRWLVWAAALPAAYFTFRSVVLLDFVPLGRFTTGQVALVLPFVALGYAAVTARLPAPMRHGLVGVTAIIALVVPAWMGLFTWQANGGAATALVPVSPISSNPPPVMQVARFLKTTVGPAGGAVVLDADEAYHDLQVGFFSGLERGRLIRVRWDDFAERLAETTPEYVVRMEQGALERRDDFEARGGRVQLGETWFEELGGFRPPLHVYRRVRAEERAPATGTVQEMPRERVLSRERKLVPAPPPSTTELRAVP